MQTLYAFKGSINDDDGKDEKFLMQSIDNMYNLYLLLISILLELHKRAKNHLEKTQIKHLATPEEKNPNKKIVNNEVLVLLRDNERLQDLFKQHKITNWDLDSDYIDILFKALLASDLYKDYMQTRTSTFKEDKDFVVDMFREIIAPNNKLYDYLEDRNITWLDDLPTVNTTILKLLRKVKPTKSDDFFTLKLYKDLEDKQFAKDLLKKTIENQTLINEEIAKKTTNWDTDRIAKIDYVLLQMAISEIQNFSSIPVKVTINEFLEIAKEYSTPKSSVFINGILDKLVKEYQKEDKLNKIGRGLM